MEAAGIFRCTCCTVCPAKDPRQYLHFVLSPGVIWVMRSSVQMSPWNELRIQPGSSELLDCAGSVERSFGECRFPTLFRRRGYIVFPKLGDPMSHQRSPQKPSVAQASTRPSTCVEWSGPGLWRCCLRCPGQKGAWGSRSLPGVWGGSWVIQGSCRDLIWHLELVASSKESCCLEAFHLETC